jgi:hypothetical protein
MSEERGQGVRSGELSDVSSWPPSNSFGATSFAGYMCSDDSDPNLSEADDQTEFEVRETFP